MKGRSSVAFSLFSKANFKILLVGDKDVGKTSLIVRYVKNTFVKTKSVSSGIEFYSKTVQVGKDEIALQIWDTASGNLHSLTKSFYQQASCVIIAYSDPAKAQSTVDKYILQTNEYASAAAMVVLVRTKVDETPMSPAEKATLENFVETQENVQMWMETSAMSALGVEDLFKTVASSLNARYNQDESFKELVDPKKDSFVLKGTVLGSQAHTKKRCCS